MVIVSQEQMFTLLMVGNQQAQKFQTSSQQLLMSVMF